ncbi:unnamed protein product [Peronospora farinosa]|uniref:Jacalin-type lectin domain-containing protein n=1 Tax=Peronospora farinosa TaxID=134698 RepID=A0AAV0URE5_9STRA|nr:unnamed protein product [Peronospora farinosa]CAI5738049.1 unnamed protein product [Peronospora farinosa]
MSACYDDGLPLLDGERRTRDSIHTALLEDKTPEILFDEDAIGDTDLDHEEDDTMSIEGSIVLDEDTKMLLYKSTGRVGSKEKWGLESLALDLKIQRVGIDISDGVLVKVEGLYLPKEKDEMKERLWFELGDNEVILKVHLFRVRREIHAIQFVTNERTSDRFGYIKHGELCKAVEAPEGKCFAGFFGDFLRGDEEIDLGFRFADRPESKDTMEAEVDVAEIDHVN